MVWGLRFDGSRRRTGGVANYPASDGPFGQQGLIVRQFVFHDDIQPSDEFQALLQIVPDFRRRIRVCGLRRRLIQNRGIEPRCGDLDILNERIRQFMLDEVLLQRFGGFGESLGAQNQRLIASECWRLCFALICSLGWPGTVYMIRLKKNSG